MNTFVAAIFLFCATAVSSAPSGPWASPLIIAPQPIYYTKPLVSGWAAPAPIKNDGWAAPAPIKNDGWAAPAPEKKEEWATPAPVKKEEWATPAPAKKEEWAAPAKNDGWAAPVVVKVDPWASSASAWSSQVVLKPAYVPLKTVSYASAPHYYVASPHSW